MTYRELAALINGAATDDESTAALAPPHDSLWSIATEYAAPLGLSAAELLEMFREDFDRA